MAEADPELPMGGGILEPAAAPAVSSRVALRAAPSRTRERPRVRKIPKKERAAIAKRVIQFCHDDEQDRAPDRERRLERYAKIRGWAGNDDGMPWPGSSNVALPDISRACQETQDTLVNAACATRPTVVAKALSPHLVDRERRLSNLLDFQFYEENDGETIMHELAQCFSDDGYFCAFVPWVDEKRNVVERCRYDPIPDGSDPKSYLRGLLNGRFSSTQWEIFPKDVDGWSWKVRSLDAKDSRIVEFYTMSELPEDAYGIDEDVEMVIEYEAEVFCGPRPIVKDFEDVLAPARCSNLQIPGPSNPGGATHVILRDYPTFDEIERLVGDGVYDLVSQDELDKLRSRAGRSKFGDVEEKQQKDVLQGSTPQKQENDVLHRDFTRLTCFDIYEMDGIAADMVWTVLEDTETLCRAKTLTELYPVPDGERPVRPLAESSYLPVKGRRVGMSLPEMMEGLHDFNKALLDQLRDLGDMGLTPFFFYQPSSDINPEITSLAPGEGYPIENPASVVFPQINMNGGAFALNLLTSTSQMQEKLIVMGDIQQGRVPAGKSSALRTTGNLQALIAQGEARPERVLRRFFMGVSDIFRLFHRLNQFFLPKEKQFRVSGLTEPGEDPYQAVTREEIANAAFDFAFMPNIHNASLQAKQESLQQTAAVLLNPLSLQAGIMRPDGIYRLTRDLARTFGQDVDQYMTPPTPESTRRKITAAGALEMILHTEMPDGAPMEGAEAHLATIEQLLQMQKRGEDGKPITLQQILTNHQAALLANYLRSLSERIAAEKQQQAQIAAAAESARLRQQQAGGGPAGMMPSMAAPQVQPNELIDESLPSAGGGAAGVQ